MTDQFHTYPYRRYIFSLELNFRSPESSARCHMHINNKIMTLSVCVIIMHNIELLTNSTLWINDIIPLQCEPTHTHAGTQRHTLREKVKLLKRWLF
jgi:hypothetical protein